MAGYMAYEEGLDTFEEAERMVLLSNLEEGVPTVFQLRSSQLYSKRKKGGQINNWKQTGDLFSVVILERQTKRSSKCLKSLFRVLKRDQNLNRGSRIVHIQVVLSKVWVLLLTHCDVGFSLIFQNCASIWLLSFPSLSIGFLGKFWFLWVYCFNSLIVRLGDTDCPYYFQAVRTHVCKVLLFLLTLCAEVFVFQV